METLLKHLNIAVLRRSLLVLCGISFLDFIITLLVGLFASNVHYKNYSPFTASWMGFASFIYALFFLLWEKKNLEVGRGMEFMWTSLGAFLALGGLVMILCFSIIREALSAVMSVLWLGTGSLFALVMYMKHANQSSIAAENNVCAGELDIPGEQTHTRSHSARQGSRCNSQCMGFCCKFASSCVVLIFVTVLSFAVVIQAGYSAKSTQPLGTIYDVPIAGDRIVQMHLFCSGPRTSNATFVFEHGAGSNCLAMKGMADELSTAGYRSCIYDRLGYGWTTSYVTSDGSAIPSSGAILMSLLQSAGEKGPFHCVGHSAGATACLEFAIVSDTNIKSVTFLDGYPDLIRAGSFEPGMQNNPGGLVFALGAFAFFVGPSGLTRGSVGASSPDFVPAEYSASLTALYAQSRFWFSQLWDVKSDAGSGDEGYLYPRLNGTRDDRGITTYGRTLQIKVLILPANKTVTTSAGNKGYLYLEQASNYASTISKIPGTLKVAPFGTEHDFPYLKQSMPWTVKQLLMLAN
jgi:pimeloyl-ACP methyl ester carboxylesterase